MSEIQSVLFDRKKFDSETARTWLDKHNLKRLKRVDKTDKYLRYRIKSPRKYKGFITKQFDRGIKAIIGFK